VIAVAKNENNEALTADIDVSKIRQIQRRVGGNADIIDGIVNRLVSDHCQPLDDYVKFIQGILGDAANPPTDRELDDFVLNLATLLYFAGEAQESLGIKEDIAKAIKMELFNETYDKAEGTIADKTAKAELATQAEFVSHIAYARAYKKVKLRVEAGNEVLQSVKKVISRRMTEYELSRVDPGRIGGTR
jgi:hypothetical protein